MRAKRKLPRAIGGAVALAGFSLLAMNAGASEQSSIERMSDRPRLAGCDGVQEWTRETFKAYATCQASIYGLEPVLAHAVMEIESGFDPQARGADGEVGLMQVMPATARMLGFRGSLDELGMPATNIAFGVEYLALANKLADGDLCTTVMKYRAGHNESRFSALSVRYCERARAILTREGLAVTGPLPVATFGFSALSGGAEASTAGENRICVRRVFVPGPRYMKCADYRSMSQARRIKALRAQLFDG
jgi:transglycosylase-like protein with SLT domain